MTSSAIGYSSKTLGGLVRLVRPKQWIKNGFVFVPIVFAGDLVMPSIVLRAVATFACFCLASGAVYIFNDLIDAQADRAHPTKRARPIPSGQVSVIQAALLSMLLAVVGLVSAFLLSTQTGILTVLYVIVHVLYSLAIKRFVLLDVFSIATGFVLRILAGATISTVPASHWILLMSFFLALLLGFGKRRGELVTLGSEAANHRVVLTSYRTKTIDDMLVVLIGMIIATYSLYTVSDYAIQRFGTDKLVFTVPFVVYGLFRYLHSINDPKTGGDPTELLWSDRSLLVTVGLWGLACVWIIYG